MDKSLLKEQKILKKTLICNAPVRNVSKNIIPGKTVAIHGVWYE